MKVLENREETAKYSTGLHKHHTEVVGGTGWSHDFSLTRNNSLGLARWLNSLTNSPDVVSYSLLPLYELMPNETQKAGVKAAMLVYLHSKTEKSSHREPVCVLLDNLASNCCPVQTMRGKLTVTNIKAWNLWGDDLSTTDRWVGWGQAYVHVPGHLELLLQSKGDLGLSTTSTEKHILLSFVFFQLCNCVAEVK